MNPGPSFGSSRQEASSRSRAYIRPVLRAELNHLDLTGRVSFNNSRVVRVGAFGDISKSQCNFNDGREKTVAVKRLKIFLKDGVDLIFAKEVHAWSRLNHTNILSLLGIAFDEPSGYPLLVSEWMGNGSSLNYIRNNNSCDLIRLVTGIAEGLAYLHDHDIVHSDIRPENIVVADSGDARICDFGESRIASASNNLAGPNTRIRDTSRYLPYEVVAFPDQNSSRTKAADVWAFGMTTFALAAQEQPYALLGESQVMKAIADRELPSFYFWTPRSSEEKAILRNICNLCWELDPKRRATMALIEASLRDYQRLKDAPRPLIEGDVDGEQREDKRRRTISSSMNAGSDTVIAAKVREFEPEQRIVQTQPRSHQSSNLSVTMDEDSDFEDSTSGSMIQKFAPPEILAHMSTLDLSNRIVFKSSRVIGTGTFGDVFKCKAVIDQKKVTVAYKRLRFHTMKDLKTVFKKEIYVWSKLNHKNVLDLLGFTFEESTRFPLLISEWMANGSSMDYVKKNTKCDLLKLVTGAAEGLEYLHSIGVVHSDIKPDNIVVSPSGDARICDFGGSRISAASRDIAKPSSSERGTGCYLAYEIVVLHEAHNIRTDIWAFGMTVFALFAQEHPYAGLSNIQVATAIGNFKLPSFYIYTTRSSEEMNLLREVCALCWRHEPRQRPSMTFIAERLREVARRNNLPRLFSAEYASSDTMAIVDDIGDVQLNENGCLYKPLVILSSKLVAIDGRIDAKSEIYQYLHSATKVYLSLHDVFTKKFTVDRKLDHLIHAIADVMALITALILQKRTIIRLLQQSIECGLFINKYSRKSFKERKLGTSDGRKIAHFISFFVVFREVLELGTDTLPAFVSSRVIYAIDELVLRQRLNLIETDTKGQQLCLLGTRVEVQEQIIGWALSTSNPNILWIHGVAGSGKSTVIASVAEHFRGIYRLGAFLRFTRGASDPSSVISTVAFRLALFDSTIGSLVLAETDRDKDVANASLMTQFEKLLVEPLSTAASAQQGPAIVILDALDECGTPATRRNLIQVFLRGLQRLPSNFRFIITSRREQDISRTFNSLQPDSVTELELDYTSHLSHRDVRTYLTHEIFSIVEDEDIPQDGSLERQLSVIVQIAAGLFVWASTIVKLASEHDSPLEKLAELASNVRSLNGIDQLYSNVLSNSGITWYDVTSRTRFQRVIGLILLSKMPLTERTIDAILGPSIACRFILSRLRSVIDYKPGEPIRLFHTSFSDYLMSSSHTEDWFIDLPEQESFFAIRCFQIMTAELRFNICDLKSSFIRNNVVDDIEGYIKSRISSHVSYACTFWAHHLCQAPYGQTLIQELSAFLYNRLLYWLEILSLVKKVGIAGPVLLATTKWIENNEMEITTFVRDARRLINIFALPISQSVPHIYLSMLPLTADESKVSAHYLQHAHISSLVRVTRTGVKRQSPLLMLLEGHTNYISSIDFSPDGSLIASCSNDKTVRIWDTESGESVAGPFDARVEQIYSIAFLPAGTRIIVGGRRGIAVLDVESGTVVIGPFGYERTECIAVSPDGKHVVSTSSKVVKMWDLESGIIVGEPFVGHTNGVNCVAYSRDGRLIVSCSNDRSVRIWDVESRRLIREPFFGHSNVNSAAFSSDGKYVVSGSGDNTIRIWDLKKGEVDYSPLTEHENWVYSVTYSSDGTRIVSASGDVVEENAVRIWNAQNGQPIAGPFKHTDIVNCVAFSPDGTRVVSGSEDGSLQIWDAEVGKTDSGPELVRDVGAVRADGTCIISDDETTHISEALVPLDQGQLLASNSIDLSKWTLDKKGWIRGVHNELLLWAPPDLRPTLSVPPNNRVINNRGFSTALDFSGSAQGERWHECFHPPE